MNNKENVQEHCKISVVNQTADHAFSLDRKLLGNNYFHAKEIIY